MSKSVKTELLARDVLSINTRYSTLIQPNITHHQWIEPVDWQHRDFINDVVPHGACTTTVLR